MTEQRLAAKRGEDDYPDDIVGDPLLVVDWQNGALAQHEQQHPGEGKGELLNALVARGG